MAILSCPMGFNLMIKAHDSNLWQIIHQKGPVPASNIKSPIFIGNIKSPVPTYNIKNPIFIGNIKSSVPNIKSPIPTDNIKSPIFIGNVKSPIPIGNIQSPFFISTILSKSPRLLILGKEKNISWYNCCLNIAMEVVL